MKRDKKIKKKWQSAYLDFKINGKHSLLITSEVNLWFDMQLITQLEYVISVTER